MQKDIIYQNENGTAIRFLFLECYSACRDNNEIQHTTSTDTGAFEIPASINNGVSQDSSSQEIRLNREAEEILSSFPPSFTSFLMNCGTAVEQGMFILQTD